jgi:hypothetical protein
MGYYDYQQGLIYRHLNQEGGWNSHLQNCRNFILKARDFYKPVKVTVLGSGWLLDFPIKEMIDLVDKICLVDIIHPPELINQVKDIKKVELREVDITGGLIAEVWQKAGRKPIFSKLRSLDNIVIPEYHMQNDPGMVISLNILTQLESLLISYIKKKAKIREEDYLRFRTDIQKKHIDFLKKYKSVLITDTTEVITEKAGNVTQSQSVVAQLPEGKFKEEWTWYFELNSSDYYNKRSVFKVMALIL